MELRNQLRSTPPTELTPQLLLLQQTELQNRPSNRFLLQSPPSDLSPNTYLNIAGNSLSNGPQSVSAASALQYESTHSTRVRYPDQIAPPSGATSTFRVRSPEFEPRPRRLRLYVSLDVVAAVRPDPHLFAPARPRSPHPHPHPHRTQTVNSRLRTSRPTRRCRLSLSLGLWHGRARCWHRQSGLVDWPRIAGCLAITVHHRILLRAVREDPPRAGLFLTGVWTSGKVRRRKTGLGAKRNRNPHLSITAGIR